MPLNPITIPNSFWCVNCSTQNPEHTRVRCLQSTCNATYCKKCVSDFHAAYYRIPKASGELPQVNSRPRCRYCNRIFHIEFFKTSKSLPFNPQNILALRKERESIRINYLQDQQSLLNSRRPPPPHRLQRTQAYRHIPLPPR